MKSHLLKQTICLEFKHTVYLLSVLLPIYSASSPFFPAKYTLEHILCVYITFIRNVNFVKCEFDGL